MGSGVLGLGRIGRPDYWRVAVDQFADHPLRGVGAGNYDRTYFLERQTTEDIHKPHSIELQTLGELGIVGGALLAILLVALSVGLARRAREAKSDPRAGGLAVAAGGTFAVWLMHTSVDWLHLIPGLTGGSTDHENVEFNFWVTQNIQARRLGAALRIARRWERIYTLGYLGSTTTLLARTAWRSTAGLLHELARESLLITSFGAGDSPLTG